VADSAGRFSPIFLDPAVAYRLVVTDADNVPLANGEVDPLNPVGTVGTSGLQDGAVTTPKLATGAVTTPKIADGNVTLAKLADIAGPAILGRSTGRGAPEAIRSVAWALLTRRLSGLKPGAAVITRASERPNDNSTRTNMARHFGRQPPRVSRRSCGM
jgi:hypothetical protein